VKDHIYKVLLGIPRQRYRWEGGISRGAESQVAERNFEYMSPRITQDPCPTKVFVGTTQDSSSRAILRVEDERIPSFPNVPEDDKHDFQSNRGGRFRHSPMREGYFWSPAVAVIRRPLAWEHSTKMWSLVSSVLQPARQSDSSNTLIFF
jgi:hypothetical protein